VLRISNLIIFACLLTTGYAQSREETEGRIANLPPAERAFERFRIWIAAQPVTARASAGQRYSELILKYRAYLKEGGFSDHEIDAQIEIVQKQSGPLEADRWNRYFSAEKPAFNLNPNAFLVEMISDRKPGRALDVAMGQGRNSLWLAQHGWDVTGFDIADQAVAIANQNAAKVGVKIHTEVKSFDEFDWGENRWDLILLSYASGAQLVSQVERGLKPGGILVVEAFHDDALKMLRIGGSLFGTGELPHLFQGLRSLHYEEPIAQPDFAPRPVRVVRFCAQKPVAEEGR
jgi:SAM-dependent methyltransferase